MANNAKARRTASLLIGLFLFPALLASGLEAAKTQFGLAVGGSGSYLEIYSKKIVYSSYQGFFADFSVLNRVTIHTGLSLTMKGVDGSLSSWGLLPVVTPIRLRVIYLEVPLLVKVSPARPVYLSGGFFLARRISGRLRVRGSTGFDNQVEDLDYGYVLGGGFKFRLIGRGNFLEFRYGRGLNPVLADREENNITFAGIFGLYF
ncbi:MAG: PorT family protein [Candidatus Aminicenantes bacterium]|nr:PorT family protein [Candidatus Aminicenantes bacterium]